MELTSAQIERSAEYSMLIAARLLAIYYFSFFCASAMARQTARDVMVADVIASI